MKISVTLVTRDDRKFFYCRWKDPVTGQMKEKSTRTTVRREAERFAGRLEDELNAGTYQETIRTKWQDGREKYERARRSKAEKTQFKAQAMFNAVERLINPEFVSSVTAPVIADYAAKLEDEELASFTVFGHLAELRKFLKWAKEMNMIRQVPFIAMPTVVDAMKGRAITGEEFDRFLNAIRLTRGVLPEFVEHWQHFATGLWLSGLRLEEAMQLHWTDNRKLCVDLSRKRPMMQIQASAEKGRTFRMLPITPDFAAFLLKTPPDRRRGFVFNPLTMPRGYKVNLKASTPPHRPTHEHVGKVLSRVGERAGIVVAEAKFASAHDLRRAFGTRWAKLVMPKILQELMRHKSIQTTMTFYVGDLADDAADEVWKAVARSGDTFSDTSTQHGESATFRE